MDRDSAMDANNPPPALPISLVLPLDKKLSLSGLEWVLVLRLNRLLSPQGRLDVRSGYSSVDGSFAHNCFKKGQQRSVKKNNSLGVTDVNVGYHIC